jgi:hypothetical protein
VDAWLKSIKTLTAKVQVISTNVFAKLHSNGEIKECNRTLKGLLVKVCHLMQSDTQGQQTKRQKNFKRVQKFVNHYR